jgi:hypothetical protein
MNYTKPVYMAHNQHFPSPHPLLMCRIKKKRFLNQVSFLLPSSCRQCVTFWLRPPFQQSGVSCSLELQSGQGKNEHTFSHLPSSYLPPTCLPPLPPIVTCTAKSSPSTGSLPLFLYDLRLLLVLKEGRCTMHAG